MYLLRTALGPVELAFTDRHGGVSGTPYATLNLARAGGDRCESRAENLRRVLTDFAPDAALCDLDQVHGATVAVADEGGYADPPVADGVVTATAGLALMVRVADCVPVLLADLEGGVIGAAHCGRQGLVAGVVQATVRRMRDLGATRVSAWVGPRVCGRCYEVPAAMRAEVGAREPTSLATTSWGTPSLDLGAGVCAQLERQGVRVTDVASCTRESPDLYSHRRDGAGAGRQAALIRLREGPGG